ncbi:MAG: hypothetical protein AAF184_17470 [Pseudomonadota bacterium]
MAQHTRFPSVAALAACSSIALLSLSATGLGDVWEQIGPTHEVSMAVPDGAHLRLDLPVGQVDVVGTDGDELRARMQIECKANKRRCAKRAERATLSTISNGNTLTLLASPEGMNAYKGAQVRITVEVPRSETLEVEFGAGELDVRDVDACVSLRMFAGEADLHLAGERIDDISLKTGMGESALYVNSNAVNGKRPLLVGSKVVHALGNGDCSLAARLRFGELTAHLH